jgi:hypothetical protein
MLIMIDQLLIRQTRVLSAIAPSKVQETSPELEIDWDIVTFPHILRHLVIGLACYAHPKLSPQLERIFLIRDIVRGVTFDDWLSTVDICVIAAGIEAKAVRAFSLN